LRGRGVVRERRMGRGRRVVRGRCRGGRVISK